jgi:transposase
MGDSRLEPLVLSEAERRVLENWAKRRKTAQGLALRARIVLACAEGRSNTAVAARLRVSRGTVTKWRARFLAGRLDGLADEPRPGVPRTITDAQVEEVVVRTLEEVPEGGTHWSKRELARQAGISPTSVHRPIDRTNGPFFVDPPSPGLLMGQASSSLPRGWRQGGSGRAGQAAPCAGAGCCPGRGGAPDR